MQIKKYSEISDQEYQTYTGIILYKDETKAWCLNGKPHRTDGPAVERSDGSKYWYFNGQLHRTDGPAIEYSNGAKDWWYQDVLIYVNSQEEFDSWLVAKVFE